LVARLVDAGPVGGRLGLAEGVAAQIDEEGGIAHIGLQGEPILL